MNVPRISTLYSSLSLPWRWILPSMLSLFLLLPASAHATYWNLFNLEGESSLNSVYITYASLLDMLNDDNRTGSFIPNNTGLSAANVVGGGAWVSLDGPGNDVPEPATTVLVVLGLLCLGYAKTHARREQVVLRRNG